MFASLKPKQLTSKDGKLWILLFLSIVVQVLYWYLGSPGPSLLRQVDASLASALRNVVWAVILFLLIPLIAMRLLKVQLSISFARGNVNFGLPIVLLGSPLIVLIMYAASSDPSLQASYPWPGAWAGETLGNFLLWAVIYAFYYLAFEFFYRGFLLQLAKNRWGLSNAIWLQTLASTLVHLGKPLSETLAAIPGGFIFALLVLRGRSLLYPIIVHLVIGLSTDLFSLFRQGLL